VTCFHDRVGITAERPSAPLLPCEQIKAWKELAASSIADLVLTGGKTATLLQP
jgi:hypothetical protein